MGPVGALHLRPFARRSLGADRAHCQAGYAHDYASPFEPNAQLTEPALHGRWYRGRIRADRFEPWVHGGRIEAESEEGRGLTLRVRLPFDVPAEHDLPFDEPAASSDLERLTPTYR